MFQVLGHTWYTNNGILILSYCSLRAHENIGMCPCGCATLNTMIHASLFGRRRLGVGTPTWRDDGRAFGKRQDKRVAMLAVIPGNGGRRQGGGARH